MKSLSLRRRAALLVLPAFWLTAQPGLANSRSTPAQEAGPAADLRVILTPLDNSPVLRVRYESLHYGAVRLELRDGQGRVLYSELKRNSRFAGDFDLAAYPPGDYTVVLQTPADHYTQTVRLAERSRLVATIVLP